MGQAVRIAVQFVSIPVLARLLTPEDFGLVATAMIVITFGDVVKDFGLGAASLQAESLSVAERSSLLWANVGLGTFLAVALVPVAYALPVVFGPEQLVYICLALAATFPVSAAQTQYQVDLSRRGRFGLLALVGVGGQLIGVSAAISLAAAGTGYWALVGQTAGSGISTLVLLIIAGAWVPDAPWRLTNIRSFLSFGANLGVSQLLGYVAANADTAIISLRFGAEQTGIYGRAFQLLIAPIYQILGPMTNVVVPALSRSRSSFDETFVPLLRRVQVMAAAPVIAIFAVAGGCANELIALALGNQWESSAGIFLILAVGGAFQVLSYVNFWTFLSLAQTRELVRYSMITKLGTVALIAVGSAWGVKGVAWGVTVSLALSWPIGTYWLHKCAKLPLRPFLAGGSRLLCAGAATLSACVATPLPEGNAVALALGVGVGTCVFVGAWAATRPGRREMRAVYSSLYALKR